MNLRSIYKTVSITREIDLDKDLKEYIQNQGNYNGKGIVQKISQDNMRENIMNFYDQIEDVETKAKYFLQNFHDRLHNMSQ